MFKKTLLGVVVAAGSLIPNMNDRDRDGDGVRNRRDRFPDNWRRS